MLSESKVCAVCSNSVFFISMEFYFKKHKWWKVALLWDMRYATLRYEDKVDKEKSCRLEW